MGESSTFYFPALFTSFSRCIFIHYRLAMYCTCLFEKNYVHARGATEQASILQRQDTSPLQKKVHTPRQGREASSHPRRHSATRRGSFYMHGSVVPTSTPSHERRSDVAIRLDAPPPHPSAIINQTRAHAQDQRTDPRTPRQNSLVARSK